MTTEKSNCVDCGVEFESHGITIFDREIFRQTRCEKCAEIAEKAFLEFERVRIAGEEQKRRKSAFNAICPPLYRDSELSRCHPEFAKAVSAWEFSSRGLGLAGLPGTGKTRAAFCLLREQINRGVSCYSITATAFSKACADQFDDKGGDGARTALRKCKSAEILLIDDIGKQRMTDRAEAEFYDLLEYRTSEMIPTIWTANSKRDGLMAMMSEDRAEAILRRLVDFSTIVGAWKI